MFRILCGVSGSLQLFGLRRDIKSLGTTSTFSISCYFLLSPNLFLHLSLSVSASQALFYCPQICFCSKQKLRLRSIFLGPALKLGAAVYPRRCSINSTHLAPNHQQHGGGGQEVVDGQTFPNFFQVKTFQPKRLK